MSLLSFIRLIMDLLTLTPNQTVDVNFLCYGSILTIDYLPLRVERRTPSPGPRVNARCSSITTPSGQTWGYQSTPCLSSPLSAGPQLPRQQTWDLWLFTAGKSSLCCSVPSFGFSANVLLGGKRFPHLSTKSVMRVRRCLWNLEIISPHALLLTTLRKCPDGELRLFSPRGRCVMYV